MINLDGELWPTVDFGYSASLFQTEKTKLGPEDAWGNVKVPRIESLDASTAGHNGWIPFGNATIRVELYSSLMGIPISNIPTTGDTDFTIESSYVSLDCPSVEYSIPYNSSNGGTLNILCNGCPDSSLSPVSIEDHSMVDADRVRSLLGVNFTVPPSNASELMPRIIDFYSINSASLQAVHIACYVLESHVETMINCTGGICQPAAIRHSLTDFRPANVTPFDYWGTAALVTLNAASIVQTGFLSPTESFLNDLSALTVLTNNDTAVLVSNLSLIPLDLFAERPSMILNTGL